MNAMNTYVRFEPNGTLLVGKSRISLDSVVYAFRQGVPAESIQQQFPDLSLEEVYGAVAYYLGNRARIDEYLQTQERQWEDFRRNVDQVPSSVVERLRRVKGERIEDVA